MANRSQSKRPLWPSLFALVGAALVLPLLAGCQSNVQQDLVAREMRMQEDQIYAMEDYLAQYQELICKYRAENAALRRQLGEDDDTLPARRPSPRDPNGPAIEVRPPRTNGTPPPQLELPEVPPLEETTSNEPDGEVALATGRTGTDDVPSATQAVALEPATEKKPIHDAWLHGEVVGNETGGGPRLIVEIEPRDADGNATQFTGPLSLMLLAADGGGAQESLARWDFAPNEVRSAIDAANEGRTIRFQLELPADTPASDPTEIWVRLLPRGGEKVLAHAAIDLTEPNRFSSLPIDSPPRERPPRRRAIAAANSHRPSRQPALDSNVNDAGWTIARPGEPATLAVDANDPDGRWRPSSEPIPTAVATSTPTRPKPRPTRPASLPAPRAKTPVAVTEALRKPGWSPHRSGEPSDEKRMATRHRPSWSATR